MRGRVCWAVVLFIVALCASAEEKPTFKCGRFRTEFRAPRRQVIIVRCRSINTGHVVPEWRLFGETDDALTDFDEKQTFEFEAPLAWRLLEMRLVDDSGERKVRLRVWVRDYGGELQWMRYGEESQ
jgi:hypothetical protein